MPDLSPSGDEDDTMWQVEDHTSHMFQKVDFEQKTVKQHCAHPLPVRRRKSKARVFVSNSERGRQYVFPFTARLYWKWCSSNTLNKRQHYKKTSGGNCPNFSVGKWTVT